MKPALLLLMVAASLAAQDDGKFTVFVAGLDTAAPVAQSLIKQLNASKPFKAVGKDQDSKVAVLVSCMDRKDGQPYGCLYVAHIVGFTSRTFMGAGLYLAETADQVATNFLSSIAQDVVERYNKMNLDNLREALEACLLMTDSKCNVPEPLQKEFDGKQLTMGQYLLKMKK